VKRGTLALLAAMLCGVARALTFSDAYVSPRNSERAVRQSTSYIILHTTEAEAASSLRKLSKNGEAHYCIDRDGKVYRIVARSRVAYHCGTSMWSGRKNLDEVSVGIEVVGYHDRALTAAQYAAIKELVRVLKKAYNIKDANVMPHAQVAYGTPNRWHPKSHRGRKRCGMGYATPAVRQRLGLKERWLADPDVKARRLVVGDAFLASVLYAKNGSSLLPYSLPPAGDAKAAAKAAKPALAGNAAPKPAGKAAKPENKPAPDPAAECVERVVAKGQTAWDVARDAYAAASTLYIFPNGRRIPGDKMTDWESLVPGTRVLLGTGDNAGAASAITLRQGESPRKLAGDAAFAADTWYVRPTGGCIAGDKLTDKTLAALPAGTRILVGYAKGGPVTSRNLPSKICPTRWDAPDTFYLFPGKPLRASGEIDMRRVPSGTLVFYRN